MSVKKTQHRKVGQESELEYVEDLAELKGVSG
jgi:hypothetical protein